jgi:hypothetical protein
MKEESDPNLFSGYGVEITLPDDQAFLKVKETLQRIGIPSYKEEKTLYQSAHILHKRGRYVIIHFLELFRLDGRSSVFSKEDKSRRDAIALMLEDWGLVKIVPKEKERIEKEKKEHVRIKVISFQEKPEWTLCAKYHIGGHKK